MVSWQLHLGSGSNDGTINQDGRIVCSIWLISHRWWCYMPHWTLRIMRKKRDGSLIYWLFSILVSELDQKIGIIKRAYFPNLSRCWFKRIKLYTFLVLLLIPKQCLLYYQLNIKDNLQFREKMILTTRRLFYYPKEMLIQEDQIIYSPFLVANPEMIPIEISVKCEGQPSVLGEDDLFCSKEVTAVGFIS